MTSKPKRRVRLVGASVLVIATVASVLSVGSASATAAEPRLYEPVGFQASGNATTFTISAGHACDWCEPWLYINGSPVASGSGRDVSYTRAWHELGWAVGETRTITARTNHGNSLIGELWSNTLTKTLTRPAAPVDPEPPVTNGGLVHRPSNAVTLDRRKPKTVQVGVSSTTKAITAMTGTMTLTAPAGTHFAPQTELVGRYWNATDAPNWAAYDHIKIRNVALSNGGKTLTGTFAPGQINMKAASSMAWDALVEVDGDATAGSASMPSRFTGTTNLGSFTATGSTAVTIPKPTLTAAGAFPADNAQRARISGVAEKNATVVIRSGGAEVGRVTAAGNDGSYTFTVPAPMAGGTKAFTVSQIVGNAESGNVAVTLDYGTAVSISTPADQSAQQPGATTISGRGENGSTVSVRVDGGTARTDRVENGTWSVQGELRRGENVITASQASRGANTTTSTVTVNPGEDGTELPAPTARIAFPDNVERRATATGTGAPGASITIFDGTRQVGNATVAANGTWGSELLAVSNGIHTLTIKQTLGDDQNEITADADYGTELTVNTPAAVQDTTEVTLTGTGTPNAKISLRDNTGTTRSTTVRTDGTWTLNGNFRPDTRTVSVASLSKGALLVQKSTTITIRIATRPITVTSPTLDDAANDRITDGDVAFTGTATPFSTVTFATTADGQGRVVFTTYADANGNWSATGWLAKSYYRLSGVQYAIGGDVTHFTMFPFSTVPFRGLDVVGPREGDVVIGGRNTFTGTATPGATVEVRRVGSGQVIARATAEGAAGAWNADAVLTTGTTYDLEAVQTALNGRTDLVSIGRIVPVASQPIDQLAFTHNGNPDDGSNITFTFLAQPGATVSVWTGAKDEAGADKPWIREMASGTADKYGHVKISGYAAANNLYNLKVYAGTEVKDWTITTPSGQ